MTTTVNIAEAKAKLSALADRAAAGEEIVLAKAGKPWARLMPLEKPPPRQPGAWAHLLTGEGPPLEAFAPEEEDAIASERDLREDFKIDEPERH